MYDISSLRVKACALSRYASLFSSKEKYVILTTFVYCCLLMLVR